LFFGVLRAVSQFSLLLLAAACSFSALVAPVDVLTFKFESTSHAAVAAAATSIIISHQPIFVVRRLENIFLRI